MKYNNLIKKIFLIIATVAIATVAMAATQTNTALVKDKLTDECAQKIYFTNPSNTAANPSSNSAPNAIVTIQFMTTALNAAVAGITNGASIAWVMTYSNDVMYMILRTGLWNQASADAIIATGTTAQLVSSLDNHTNATGVNVHGLGSASTNNTSDFATPSSVIDEYNRATNAEANLQNQFVAFTNGSTILWVLNNSNGIHYMLGRTGIWDQASIDVSSATGSIVNLFEQLINETNRATQAEIATIITSTNSAIQDILARGFLTSSATQNLVSISIFNAHTNATGVGVHGMASAAFSNASDFASASQGIVADISITGTPSVITSGWTGSQRTDAHNFKLFINTNYMSLFTNNELYVSGFTNPPWNGVYVRNGTCNGSNLWTNASFSGVIYFNSFWYIGPHTNGNAWCGSAGPLIGPYTGGPAGFTGMPVVAQAPYGLDLSGAFPLKVTTNIPSAEQVILSSGDGHFYAGEMKGATNADIVECPSITNMTYDPITKTFILKGPAIIITNTINQMQQDIIFSSSVSTNFNLPMKYVSVSVGRGSIYNLNTNILNEIFQLSFYENSDYKATNAYWRANLPLVASPLAGNTGIGSPTGSVVNALGFYTNDLVFFQTTGIKARIVAITNNTLYFEDTLIVDHTINEGIARVAEFGGFTMWDNAGGTNMFGRISSVSAITCTNRIEIKYVE